MERELTMLMVGDVFVLRDDPPSAFRHVENVMRSADFVLGNLEGSACDLDISGGKAGAADWKAGSRQLTAVQAAGFHALNVANNHMMDFGTEAMLATTENLDRIGIKHTGGGRTFAEAHAPAILERHGCKVAMLGYTCVFKDRWAAGPNSPGLAVIGAHTSYETPKKVFELPGMPPIIHTWAISGHKAQLGRDIAAARAQADIVVCTFHWGVSKGYKRIAEYQIELGRFAVDSGADVVFGHHPHLLQGVEVHNGRAIFYSLGNFTFAHHEPDKGHEYETGMVRCRIRNKHIRAVEFLPARNDEKLEPRLLSMEQGRDIVELLRKRSVEFGTSFGEAEDGLQVIGDAGRGERSKAA